LSRARTLQVPGGRLHYEVRGSGSALLMIPGSNGDAGLYDGVADRCRGSGPALGVRGQGGASPTPSRGAPPAISQGGTRSFP
jgi:pimeloyl-ACP methyl ester carboxylesterase